MPFFSVTYLLISKFIRIFIAGYKHYRMKTKRNNPIWGFIVMLSLLVMTVAFIVGNLDVTLVSGGIFFITCLILGNRLFRKLDGANSGIFDDYGYL